MNLVETCKVLCSNSFWIELVWWIAEEENCERDGFFIFLVVEYWYCLTENTCSIHWNAFDSRSDARTRILVNAQIVRKLIKQNKYEKYL